MKIVKSLGLKGCNIGSFKRQELLLVKCECGVLLKKSKEAFEMRPDKTCGFCAQVPSIVLSLEEKYLSKGCEIVAFKIKPKEHTNHSKWLEIIYEQNDKICKTKVSYQNANKGMIINGVDHWSSPWNKKDSSGIQEPGEHQKLSSEESSLMPKESEIATENQNENEGEIMLNTTANQLENRTSRDITEPQNPQLVCTGAMKGLEDVSVCSQEESLVSMSLIDDSARHLFTVMKDLRVEKVENCSTAQIVKVAEAINSNCDNVKAIASCAKEIRELLKLKLDMAKFIHEVDPKILKESLNGQRKNK